MKKKAKSKGKKRNYRSKKSRTVGKRMLLGAVTTLFLIIGYFFFTGNKSLIELYMLHNEHKQLIQRKNYLIEENKKLEKEIERLQTDSRYILEIARTRYNLKKKNEVVICFSSK